MIKHKRIFQRLGAGLFLIFLGAAGVVGLAGAQNVTQGYQTEQSLQKGMLVRLAPDDGTKIQAVTQKDEMELLGVIISPADAAVSLSNTEAKQELYVANYGRYEALLSTQGGAIKTGDYIAVSSLAGVGMKADTKREFVVGKVLEDFDGVTNREGSAVLKTSAGDKTVYLGRVRVDIAIARNPFYNKDDIPGVPTILESMAQVVTDEPVGAFRIYASLGVLLACIIVAGVILVTGVRTGMISIGRNPLAKKTITRNLVRVILISLIVFVIGAIAVYLLLRV